MSEKSLRRAIVDICHRLYSKNLLASADGNASTRLDQKKIIITPSGCAKAYLQPEDLCIVSIDGEVLEGNPSSERTMHLTVYQNCPKAKAVVHAHPPHAIAWSIAHPDLEFLPDESISELILAVGRIPMVPYARPGTIQMGENLLPFLPKHRVMILARHGAIGWGESLDEAYFAIERLEHTAQILYLAESLGGLTKLPAEEVQYLIKKRKTIGNKAL